MKKHITQSYDRLIAILLGILGTSTACLTSEYGVPHGDYKVLGTIIDQTTGQPIQNIQVTSNRYGDTIYSDAQGKYDVTFVDNYQNFLKIEDIDGEENGGEFGTQEINIEFTKADQVEKGKNWYEGKFVKTQNIELTKKENNEKTID